MAAIDDTFTPKIRNLDLDGSKMELGVKCDFVRPMRGFLLDTEAISEMLLQNCKSEPEADDVDAHIFELKLLRARMYIKAQRAKMKPWLPRCPE